MTPWSQQRLRLELELAMGPIERLAAVIAVTNVHQVARILMAGGAVDIGDTVEANQEILPHQHLQPWVEASQPPNMPRGKRGKEQRKLEDVSKPVETFPLILTIKSRLRS